MYLVMAIEHFPDSEPVTTLEVRDREDDAIMLARCMCDEAKNARREAGVFVYRIDLASPIYRRTIAPPRQRKSKRGCRR